VTRANPRHVASLDGVRAIAAFAVIATHAGFNSGRSLDGSWFAHFLARLDFGVTLFFLLSGFLLYRPFAASAIEEGSSPRVGAFWWRRFLRIMPAYLLAVIVTLAFLTPRHPAATEWASYLTLTQTYTGNDLDPSLQQMWTLATEIAFYAALPVLALTARKFLARRDRLNGQLILVLALFPAALLANVLGHAAHNEASLLWLPAYLDWFALGMLIALVSATPVGQVRAFDVFRAWASNAPGTCLLIGVLLFWLSTFPMAGPYGLAPLTPWEWTIKHYLYGASAFFLLIPVMLGRSEPVGRVLGNRSMVWLGTVSYGVYLWHLPLLIALSRWLDWPTFGGNFVEMLLLTAVTATAVAAVSWYGLERPILRNFSRPWRRNRARGDGNNGRNREQAQDLDDTVVQQRPG
jgi:peptidoglycan/LPS O-acetylase OafA/YrhL